MGLGTRQYNWNPSTLEWEAATQTDVTVGELTVSGVAVSNFPGIITEQYDSITLGYDGTQLKTVTYKLASATVATLTLTYLGDTLLGVAKS